jgi:hypothetical protein
MARRMDDDPKLLRKLKGAEKMDALFGECFSDDNSNRFVVALNTLNCFHGYSFSKPNYGSSGNNHFRMNAFSP